MKLFIQENHSLQAHNTFGFDVEARAFVTYHSVDELIEALDYVKRHSLPSLCVGCGSNLLFTRRFEGAILHSAIDHIIIEEPQQDNHTVKVKAGGGVLWDDLCALMARRGYYGSENLSLIPGQVGAAAVQNIGAYGVEVCNLIQEVHAIEVATGKPRVFSVEECRYGYRDSIFKHDLCRQYVVTEVVFRLSTEPRVNLSYGSLAELQSDSLPTAQAIRERVIEIRQSKLPDPQVLGNAGSFFKNPIVSTSHFRALLAHYPLMPHFEVSEREVKIPAAWLIEQCGWKGKQEGGAQVFARQPLVLVNTGDATPSEVMQLSAKIQASVKARFGIELATEVNFIE